METTIKISKEVKEHLNKMKIFERETYNDIIEILIEDNMELSDKTRKELREREKNPKFISHEEVRKRIGL